VTGSKKETSLTKLRRKKLKEMSLSVVGALAAKSRQEKVDFLVKLLLVGDSGVGKTCLMQRFTKNEFVKTFITTIGVDWATKTIDIDGYKVELQIWDTAGQERYRSIANNSYRNAMGILMVYDVENAASFDHIRYWIQQAENFNCQDTVHKAILGNKCDALPEERQVSTEAGQALANQCINNHNNSNINNNNNNNNSEMYGSGVPFIETSAKENVNVDQAFMLVIRPIVERMKLDRQHKMAYLAKETVKLIKIDNNNNTNRATGSNQHYCTTAETTNASTAIAINNNGTAGVTTTTNPKRPYLSNPFAGCCSK
jgi:Ras-related protein Rab-8A